MLKMLSDFVLVMVDKVEEKTSGGLYLTASTAEKPHTGLVVAVGPGKRSSTGELIEHGIAAGDKIVFPTSALSNKLEHDGEEYHIMLAEQIFGIDQ